MFKEKERGQRRFMNEVKEDIEKVGETGRSYGQSEVEADICCEDFYKEHLKEEDIKYLSSPVDSHCPLYSHLILRVVTSLGYDAE